MLLETEQAWLAAVKPDLVVSDIVPLACAAAAAVGIPCVCISNFSWGVHHCLDVSHRVWMLRSEAREVGLHWGAPLVCWTPLYHVYKPALL